MSSRNLSETIRTAVIDHIKANIEAALAEMRTDRPDNFVGTESPRSYFIFPEATAYQMPAIYVIAGEIDKKKQRGANHINATLALSVSIIVEDVDIERLTIKNERYGVVLDKLLDQTILMSSNNRQKMVVIVRRMGPSPTFKHDENEGTFRKEFYLECDVEFFENFDFL